MLFDNVVHLQNCAQVEISNKVLDILCALVIVTGKVSLITSIKLCQVSLADYQVH